MRLCEVWEQKKEDIRYQDLYDSPKKILEHTLKSLDHPPLQKEPKEPKTLWSVATLAIVCGCFDVCS